MNVFCILQLPISTLIFIKPYKRTVKEHLVLQAKEIFMKMYPDSEFLPRAPDPEEIIIGEDAILEFDNDHNSHIEVGQETTEATEPLP